MQECKSANDVDNLAIEDHQLTFIRDDRRYRIRGLEKTTHQSSQRVTARRKMMAMTWETNRGQGRLDNSSCSAPLAPKQIMPLGIDPKVDFAFKMVFGNPEHTEITIHFLNAVLSPLHPIEWVEILNPIQGKDRSEDKLVVLDVLARDTASRLFNIEMQTTLPTDLPKRLTYYNCLNYVRQIQEGSP